MRHAFLAAGLLLAAAAFADTPSKAKVHGLTLTGTVVSFDAAARKMTVKSAAGRQVPLVWTGATRTAGGTVKTGVKVTVRYLQKEGKNIATSIRIEPTEPASASTRVPATPTATASGVSRR